MIPWLSELVGLAHQRLLAQPRDHEAWAYLRERGVGEEAVIRYRIGWVFAPYEVVPTVPVPEQFWTGWMGRYGWSRLLFPLTDPWGDPMGFQLRSVGMKGFANWVDPTLKQLTPTAFGLHEALPSTFASGRIVLVEGIFDYFAVRAYTPEVVASMTSMASRVLRRMLARYCHTVVALWDMDAPGRRGCFKLAGLPLAPELRDPKDPVVQRPQLPPYQVLFPQYSEHDPSDLLKAGKLVELARLARFGEAPQPECPP